MQATIDRTALEHLQSHLFGFHLDARTDAVSQTIQVSVSRPAVGRTVRAELSSDEFGNARLRVAFARRVARLLNGPATAPAAA